MPSNRAGPGPATTLTLGEQPSITSQRLSCHLSYKGAGTPLPIGQAGSRAACFLDSSPSLDREQDTVSHPESFTLVPYSVQPPTGSAYFHLQDGVETPTSPEGLLCHPHSWVKETKRNLYILGLHQICSKGLHCLKKMVIIPIMIVRNLVAWPKPLAG